MNEWVERPNSPYFIAQTPDPRIKNNQPIKNNYKVNISPPTRRGREDCGLISVDFVKFA